MFKSINLNLSFSFIAQIGKSFRNEISPKNGLLRQREFLMAEIEHFLDADLKFKSYDKFQQVKDLDVNLWSEENQIDGGTHFKVNLNEAISRV